MDQIIRKKKMILLARAEMERKAALSGQPGSGSFLSQLVSSAVRTFKPTNNRDAMVSTLEAEVRSPLPPPLSASPYPRLSLRLDRRQCVHQFECVLVGERARGRGGDDL
jgi:hypothetical protein